MTDMRFRNLGAMSNRWAMCHLLHLEQTLMVDLEIEEMTAGTLGQLLAGRDWNQMI